MKYFIFIISIIFISCSSDDEVQGVKENSKPGIIKINDIVLDGKKITIDWTDAEDKDGDQIFYKLYINSILITETTESIYSTNLSYNEDHIGRIIGTDKRGGTTEISFEFSSSNSKILLYNSSGTLHALDLYTLKPIWEAKTSFIESHVASNNLIYSGVNGINGLDILSGRTIWKSTPSIYYNTEYRNIIVDDTYVFAFDSNSTLFCVDKVTKGKLWERRFLNNYAPLTIDTDKIFVCSRNNDHLYAINKQTGITNWSFKLESNASKINTNPLIVNNTIFFGDNLGGFYSLNKGTGIKNWSIDVGHTFYSSPTQFKESIITGTYKAIYAFDINTGNTIWQYFLNGGVLETSPFIYDDKVYIGVSKNGSGELLCLNANNGGLIWRFDLENNTTSSPIVFENTVYIGDWNKNMYALNAHTGTLNWKIKSAEIVTKSPTIVIGSGKEVIYPSVNGLKN